MLAIRKMKPKDVKEAANLTKEIMSYSWEHFEQGHYPKRALEFDISRHSPENYLNQLKDKSRFSFIAEQNNKIMGITTGAILGTPGLTRLGWIGVHAQHQKRGVGKALMQKVIKHSKTKGCHKITLYTLPCLIPAINLYLKLGFVPEAYLRKEWWSTDFLKMSLWLKP